MEDGEVYLFVENKDDPDFGKTIAVPEAEWMQDIKGYKEMGYRPATGGELAPVQQSETMKIAAEHPGTAMAMGGLRGATLGASDVIGSAIDPEWGKASNELIGANPIASGVGELGGAVLTGGLAARGGAALARGGGGLVRAAAAGGVSGGAYSGGMETARQAREGNGYDLGNIAGHTMQGALVGAVLPVAGRAAGAGVSLAGRGVEKGLRSVPSAVNKLGGLADKAGKFDKAVGGNLTSSVLLDTLGGGGGFFTGSRMALKVAGNESIRDVMSSGALKLANGISARREIAAAARNVMNTTPGISARMARQQAKKTLEKKAAEAMGGSTRLPSFKSTEQMSSFQSISQRTKKAEVDKIEEEIRALMSQLGELAD